MRSPETALTGVCDIVLATPPPETQRTAEENLGIGYLTSMLRANDRSVHVVDGWLRGMTTEQMADEILQNQPELFLGFACYRTNMERAMRVATLVRQSGLLVPLVAGGFGPTFHTQEFLDAGFDVVVRGEAEETVLDLASHYATGRPDLRDISGISFRDGEETVDTLARPGVRNIDELPFPSRDTMQLAIARRSPVHILSARGCEAHCVFCSIVAFQKLAKGPQWRQRSIGNFVDELEDVHRQGARYFKVIDDSLIEPPRDEAWCAELADEVQGRGLQLRLRGSIRADRVTDGVVRELRRAGFFAFSCGIENGSASALHRMGKTARLEQNHQALETFQKYGIYIQAGHILFDHGTTMQELEENYAFLKQYDWTISKGIFTEMYAADGTPFTKLLERRGKLQEDSRGLGNNTYAVEDPEVRKVYTALKTWQRSHAKTYDMAIDAISAPKALEPEELALFHPLCIELKQLDLQFMRQVLDMVKAGATDKEVREYTQQTIEGTEQWYKSFQLKVSDAYGKTGLVYDAEENPFLCD